MPETGQFHRLLGRPPTFAGADEDWAKWTLKFSSVAATLSPEASLAVEEASTRTTPVAIERSTAGLQGMSRQFNAFLVNFTSGRALQVGRTVHGHNGLEAWRQLYDMYEPSAGSRSLGLLMQIINFDFGDREVCSDRLKFWKNLMDDCKWSIVDSLLPDFLKLALMVRGRQLS